MNDALNPQSDDLESESGPWLIAAMLCNGDIPGPGGMISYIDVVNAITVDPATISGPLVLTLVIRFANLGSRRRWGLEIRRQVTGGTESTHEADRLSRWLDYGHVEDLPFPVSIRLDRAQTIVFDVFIGDRLMTRVPFTIEHRTAETRQDRRLDWRPDLGSVRHDASAP